MNDFTVRAYIWFPGLVFISSSLLSFRESSHPHYGSLIFLSSALGVLMYIFQTIVVPKFQDSDFGKNILHWFENRSIRVSELEESVNGSDINLRGAKYEWFWEIFSVRGRRNRAQFLKQHFSMLFLFVCTIALFFVTTTSLTAFIMVVTLCILVCVEFFNIVRRLHDIDESGWFYFAIFIPVVNIVMPFILFFKKGTAGPNRYGAPSITPPDRE